MAKKVAKPAVKPATSKTAARAADGAATHAAPESSLPGKLLKDVDAWAKAQSDTPDRPEAIRRLLVSALEAAKSGRRLSDRSAIKASEMAGHTLDKLGDSAASPDERAKRKHRLLKGPKEFR